MFEPGLTGTRRGGCSGQREQKAKSGFHTRFHGVAWVGVGRLRGLDPLGVKGVVEGGDQEWCDPAAASGATGDVKGRDQGLQGVLEEKEDSFSILLSNGRGRGAC